MKEPACVYFVLAPAPLNAIKIGVCHQPNVAKRVAQIQCSLPLSVELLGLVPGNRIMEKALKLQCADWHIRGEWFRDCEGVRSVIDAAFEEGRSAVLDAESAALDAAYEDSVRRLRNLGETHDEIGQKMGMSRQAVQQILQRLEAA